MTRITVEQYDLPASDKPTIRMGDPIQLIELVGARGADFWSDDGFLGLMAHGRDGRQRIAPLPPYATFSVAVSLRRVGCAARASRVTQRRQERRYVPCAAPPIVGGRILRVLSEP